MFSETPRKIGHFVLNYRWPIIILNILLMVSVMYFMKNRAEIFQEHVDYMGMIRNNPLAAKESHESPPPIFNSDYRIWFEEDNPELISYDKFQRVFSKEENLIVVLVAKNGDVFTPRNLESLLFITEKSWTVPYVIRVNGLANFNYTYVEDDDLLVEDFIYDADLSPEELAEKKRLALSDPLMPKFLVSPKGDITQVQMQVIVPVEFPNGYLETRSAIEALAAKITDEYIVNENGEQVPNPQYNPNLEIRLGGTVMLSTSFQKFAESDIQNLMPMMLLFIIVFLAITLRSFWGTTAPIVLLLTSVLFPVALFVGFFKFSLTNVSANVMQMLVAVAIADSVHVLAIFYRGLRNGLDKRGAVIFTVEKNFLPCLITTITTAIGFYSLMLQNLPPFFDLGLFGGTGVLYAFLASLFTLPAFLSLLPFKKREVNEKEIQAYEGKGYEWLSGFVVTYQKPIRWLALTTTILGLFFVSRVLIDNTAINYFAEHTEFRQAAQYIDDNIIGVSPLEFQFDAGSDNGIYDPEYLKKIERFQEYIASHPEYEITHVAAITDVIKRINKTMNGDNPAYYKIPEDGEITADGDTIDARRLIAQYLLLYQMSLPQGMELTNQIDIRNRTTRVTAFLKSISSFQMLEYTDQIDGWIAENLPGVNATAMGVPMMFGRLMAFAIPGMLKSLMVSLFLITIVLMVTFRSVKVGFYSMIPNVWPLIIVFGFIGLLQTPVNMSVAVVGMITLGIAVDDTVHFLTKYLRGKQHEGLNSQQAITYAFRQVAAPLMFTSVILLAGFGSLIQSDFVLNSDIALYATMVIALALFADFILLPATILLFDRKKETASKTGQHEHQLLSSQPDAR